MRKIRFLGGGTLAAMASLASLSAQTPTPVLVKDINATPAVAGTSSPAPARVGPGNTYVDDCVAATVAAVRRGRPGDTLNIGGGRSVELLEALEILATALGVRPSLEFRPAIAGDQRDTQADIGRAREALGWEPSVDPDDGLTRFAAWVRSTTT